MNAGKYFVLFLIVTLACPSLEAMPTAVREAVGNVRIDQMFGGVRGEGEDLRILRQYVSNPNADLIVEMDTAPENVRFVLLNAAIDWLPDPRFLEFVPQIFRGVVEDRYPRMYADLIFLSKGREGFLAVNYEDPELRTALARIREVYSDDPDRQRGIDEILSGRNRIAHIEWYESNDLEPRKPVSELVERRMTSPHGSRPENPSSGKRNETGISPGLIDRPWFWPALGTASFALLVAAYICLKNRGVARR